jgi:hypothetical protein
MFIWPGRYVTYGLAAVLVIGGAGAALALHDAPGSTRDRADVAACGLVTCAALRSASHAAVRSGTEATGAPADTQPPAERLADRDRAAG